MMTPKEFTGACVRNCSGVLRLGSLHAYETNQCEAFVNELIEQITDEKAQDTTHRALGSTLYGELLELKNQNTTTLL